MAYKGWYAIKPKQPTNQPTMIIDFSSFVKSKKSSDCFDGDKT